MTPETFTAQRAAAKMTQAALAAFLGLSERQVIRYEQGVCPIPGPVRIIVENLMTEKLPKIPS
jgi:transcriptional regulator with XRE-family HTH domain